MATRFGVVLHPWLHGNGEVFERLCNEVAPEFVTVPVVTGPLIQLSADPPSWHQIDGGWHYSPDSAEYETGQLRPRAARWFGRRNVLAPIRDAAARRGVELHFEIDLRRAPSVCDSPGVRGQAAWGQADPRRGACPSHPAVRMLLRSLLDDLESFAPAGIALRDWHPHHPAGAAAGRTPPDEFRRLFDLCFCDACRECAAQADVDPDQAARSATVHLAGAWGGTAAGIPAPAAVALADDQVLRGYIDAIDAANRAWLADLVGRRPRPAQLRLLSTDLPAADAPGWRSQVCRPARDATVAEFAGAAAEGRASAVRLACGWLDGAQPAEVVRCVRSLAEHGVDCIEFADADTGSPAVGDWLRQAVRFVRRG